MFQYTDPSSRSVVCASQVSGTNDALVARVLSEEDISLFENIPECVLWIHNEERHGCDEVHPLTVPYSGVM